MVWRGYYKKRTLSKRGGKLIQWTVDDLCKVINQMQENKFDCVSFIDGLRGLGKSTLAYKISCRLKAKFNPKRDICYSRDQVIRALSSKIKGVIFADEMINVAYNRDFYESDQKVLLKGLNMYRDSCNVFIGCIPRFVDLDVQIQKLCKIRITVLRRGVAIIQKQIPSMYTNDPWDIKNNKKIEGEWNNRGVIKPRYGQLSTVIGILRFNDITPKQRKLYESIKKEKRNKVFEQYESEQEKLSPENTWYKKLLERVKARALDTHTFRELCLLAGKNYKSVRTRVNELLKDSGDTKTFKDYVSLNNNKGGKVDDLGFKS